MEHETVLLQEAITGLNINPDSIYVDATYGRGGHAQAILAQLHQQAMLLVIDKDPTAIAHAEQLAARDPRVKVFQGSFAELTKLATQQDVAGKVAGILFDLGVSSPQLDQAERGFSFRNAGALDMRMDPTTGISVMEWLAKASTTEIADVLHFYGEERFSKRIANAIVTARAQQPITTTTQLAEIISHAMPVKEKHKHPATRSFQALRIYINRELDDLSAVLPQVLNILAPQGRLVVISFHSLEDRIVKQFIAHHAKGDIFPHLLPVKHTEMQPKMRKIGKAIKPGEAEVACNARARSAVLRIAEKLEAAAND